MKRREFITHLGGTTVVLSSFALCPARAALIVCAPGGSPLPLPIAVTEFTGGTPVDAEMARIVTEVISNNLQRSGVFEPINPAAFIEKNANNDAVPRLSDWRAINAQSLVTGHVSRESSDGRIRAEFRLWDVSAGRQIDGKQYFARPDNWRRIAHTISDAIYERLTGDKGYFSSRIAFVDESGPRDRRVRRLAVMDQDGANVNFLTRGDESVLTPRFSPTAREIVYTSYAQQTPRVMLMNIETRQREAVSKFPGMTFAPGFSPDGQRVVMSWQEGVNCHIIVVDLRSGVVSQLTKTATIDTAPSFSPDGERICFESEQQIYVMPANGGEARRISFGEGRYVTPVWSPRGDNIAFTKISAGKFTIGTMKPDGSGELIVSGSFHDEGPTFSPNGRVIMSFRDPGGNAGPQLFTIDITGRNEQKVPTPGFASDPAWSPLLI